MTQIVIGFLDTLKKGITDVWSNLQVWLRNSLIYLLSCNWRRRDNFSKEEKEWVSHPWGLISFISWLLTFLKYPIQELCTSNQNCRAGSIKIRGLRAFIFHGQWRRPYRENPCVINNDSKNRMDRCLAGLEPSQGKKWLWKYLELPALWSCDSNS